MIAAIAAGQVDIVVNLLKRGVACPNEADKKGSTPLHFACGLDEISAEEEADNQESGCDDRTVSIIQALLANGADIDKLDNNERTPLAVALMYSPSSAQVRAAIALIDAGANLQIYYDRATAVSLAIDVEDANLWKAILRRKAEVDVSVDFDVELEVYDGSGNLPLVYAAQNDRVDLIELLVDGGAYVLARVAFDDEFDHEYDRPTPLLAACYNLQLRAARCLLKLGANVDDCTLGEGDTCLHSVAPYLCPRPGQAVDENTETAADLVELLLEWGADETAENYSCPRKTPADLAKVGHLLGTPGPYNDQLGLTRGQLLLLNAGREKAWRRRGLLVLCRTHPNRVRLTLQDAKRHVDWFLGGKSQEEANSLGE